MTIAALVLLSITGFAQSGKSIYSKYSEAENVSAVYVSPAMFRMIGKLPGLEVGGEDIDISSLVKTIEGFYLIDSENQDINATLSREVETMVKKGNFELLMEIKEDGEIVHLYTTGSEKEITGLVFLVSASEECTFICLDGRMPRDRFEDLISSQM